MENDGLVHLSYMLEFLCRIFKGHRVLPPFIMTAQTQMIHFKYENLKTTESNLYFELNVSQVKIPNTKITYYLIWCISLFLLFCMLQLFLALSS